MNPIRSNYATIDEAIDNLNINIDEINKLIINGKLKVFIDMDYWQDWNAPTAYPAVISIHNKDYDLLKRYPEEAYDLFVTDIIDNNKKEYGSCIPKLGDDQLHWFQTPGEFDMPTFWEDRDWSCRYAQVWPFAIWEVNDNFFLKRTMDSRFNNLLFDKTSVSMLSPNYPRVEQGYSIHVELRLPVELLTKDKLLLNIDELQNIINNKGSISENTTIVSKDSLFLQANQRDLTHIFQLLNGNHPRQAPELAIAIKAWLEAVEDDTITQNVKAGIDRHIPSKVDANAARERISKVINWNKSGNR
ncbi:MAG: hypothetical protein ACK5NC_05315 [Vibrio sp.]